ncbi:type III secretion system export apparatus subunit SctU [Prosthecomicrobium hirschii]|uniref:Translocation protein in type III secretion n=1 Tax=Prosthecodimorpha hirschii TaxID=665126 RepID=A0A0P6VP11_9HYPH|nr:type III secretion system export apparatus subunit SctU [Prosthecomicrobium hirschii]KPL52132.1 translocation protein in type III secretion [Prosthecomicrobium hirschii]MCW1843484.1 type III secretion system export apparatus subunit SctU [Prosthecomicrobium hirschii]TPQ48666.1 EscU/YscU/HrcU family type III secretion system export apparatus switch protein [Prosthecomicrobium hirschii]
MSEGGEKTELPTPKKVRDARAKGQVARSQEVVTTISLLSVIAYLWATSQSTNMRLIALMNDIAQLSTGDFRTNAYNGISIAFSEGVSIMMPVLGVAIFSAIAANYMQFGSIFALENLTPKLDKISPAQGFKKIFSMKNLIENLKSVAKIIFLSILLYFVVRDSMGAFLTALPCGLTCLASVASLYMGKLLAYTAFALIVVALIDFAYQRHTYTKSLMMSKDEVKREYKESEGDPHIKGHRKQLAMELIMGDGGHQARKSSAVVINPTHFAVCIAYRPDELPLPMIVAKGRNLQAHYLRTEAEQAGVPIFRNVPLARALFADCDPGEFVPDELFDAIAEVLAWVERNKDTLYKGPLPHGVIDMEAGDHRVTEGVAHRM